jgi:hypothetical protein
LALHALLEIAIAFIETSFEVGDCTLAEACIVGSAASVEFIVEGIEQIRHCSLDIATATTILCCDEAAADHCLALRACDAQSIGRDYQECKNGKKLLHF